MSREFESAIGRMVNEVAYAGAVRHLHDLGYSVSEIRDTLWQYLTETGRILLSEPRGEDTPVRYTYIKETDALGRSSFRRVSEEIEGIGADTKYVPCDFGLIAHRDPEAYEQMLGHLTDEDRIYVADIPWPRQRVWHIMDERMKRINDALNSKDIL